MSRPRAFHQLLPYRDTATADDGAFDPVFYPAGKVAAVGGVAVAAATNATNNFTTPAECPTVMEVGG